jgi:mycothiol synthase
MDADAIATVSELLAAAERADGHPALADHQWLDLVSGGRAGFAGLVAWEPGHAHPVAYAQVSRGNDSWGLELVVDPHHRYEMATIGPELLGAAADVVHGEGGGRLHWWVFEATTIHHELAAQIGLHPTRLLHQMRRPLPTGLPVTIDTRAFRVGLDEQDWLRVNNRAFAEHPEQGGWDLATILARENEAWFNPQGFRLHEHEGRLAGFCWTKIHADRNPPLGEIYVIAVDPDFHGLGLGRQLTLAGLDWLSRAGITIGMLHVDADNLGAVSLYRSLGFAVHHDSQAFVGDIL